MALCVKKDNPSIKQYHQLVGIYWLKNSINKNLIIAIVIGRWQLILMKELQENTINQTRRLLRYLTETDLLNNKEVLRYLDLIAREHGGEILEKN